MKLEKNGMVRVGKGEPTYQKNIELGRNSDGKVIAANCHCTEKNELVYVYIFD